jgi:general secretion pathway protein K
MRGRSSGVALVLVLMVTAVLAITVLSLSLGSQARVRQSAERLERTETDLRAHSHESAVAFSLMTQPWVASESRELLIKAAGPYGESWNFRGQAFRVNEAQIRIQDESGLYALSWPKQSQQELVQLLESLGFTPAQVKSALMRLAEQSESNSAEPSALIPVQDLSELFVDSPVDQKLLRRLEGVVTLAPVKSFNPATAPREILAVRFGETTGSRLYELGARGEMDSASYLQVVGVPMEETTMIFPGPIFRVWVAVRGKGSITGREAVWVVRPYDFEPFSEWSSRRVASADSEGPI